jgi:nitrogen regulatory protein PII
MHPIQRVEIIATAAEKQQILNCLDKVGVPGYTVIDRVTGKSSRGKVSDDFDLSADLSNTYIICFCSQDLIEPLVVKLRPILNKFGGVCYVSEAMEIRSLKCVAS